MADLFGVPYHAGSWFGLPDFGLTEGAAYALNGSNPVNYANNLTAQGGSNVLGTSGSANNGSSVLGVSSQVNPQSNLNGYTIGGTPTSNTGVKSSVNVPTNAPIQGPQLPSGSATNAFDQAISDAYGPSSNYLDQAEQNLRNDYPSVLNDAELTYNTNASTLGDQKQSAFDTLSGQQNQATQGKESALAAARRQFQEQQIGTTQRFGGSSSAGQALSELQSRSLAEQMGKTNRQYTDVYHNIEQQHNSIEREYNTNIMALQTQKQLSISQANRDFQNKLLQISQSRAQIGQAKAQANLQALQDLRNHVYSIEMQNLQFQQTLELQRQQAKSGLSQYAASVLGATNTSGQAAANPYASMTNNYSVGNAQPASTQAANPYVGAISSAYPSDKKDYYNLIA